MSIDGSSVFLYYMFLPLWMCVSLISWFLILDSYTFDLDLDSGHVMSNYVFPEERRK